MSDQFLFQNPDLFPYQGTDPMFREINLRGVHAQSASHALRRELLR